MRFSARRTLLLVCFAVLLRLYESGKKSPLEEETDAKRKKAAEKDLDKLFKRGKEWLEQNARREGVITLPSGLQYKVLKNGTGVFHPRVTTKCHIMGKATTLTRTPDAVDKHMDNWDFYVTDESPGAAMVPPKFFQEEKRCQERGKAVAEAMMLMVEGDSWELYIPPTMDYRKYLTGENYLEGETIVYRFELVQFAKGFNVGKRKYKCNIKTSQYCMPEEKRVLDQLPNVTLDDVITLKEQLKKKKQRSNKELERKKYTEDLLFLGTIEKAMKMRQLEEL